MRGTIKKKNVLLCLALEIEPRFSISQKLSLSSTETHDSSSFMHLAVLSKRRLVNHVVVSSSKVWDSGQIAHTKSYHQSHVSLFGNLEILFDRCFPDCEI